MGKCLNCESQIENTPGRRPKKFCDNKGKCRNEWHRKHKPKKASKMKWVVTVGGKDISDKCMVDPKNWVLSLPENLLTTEATTINVDYSKMEGMPKTFTEILEMAKGGAARSDVEKEIRIKGNLTPGQQDVIRRKIIT